MNLNAALVFIVLPVAMSPWLHAEVRMRSGLWENTVTSAGQSATRKVCITAEQEARSNDSPAAMRASIEKALAKTGSCKLEEFSVTGNTRTEVLACAKSTIKNTTTFHGDSFETVGSATTDKGVKTSQIKGRRLGECPAGGVQ